MKYIKKIIIIIIISMMISVLFQGCWDKVEIDRKTYVSSVGIDVGREDNMNPQMVLAESRLLNKCDRTKIKVTYGIPNLGLHGKEIGIPEEETITMNVYSLADALAEGNAKSSRAIRSDHVKMIIFSKEVLKYTETVKEIVDYINRHPLFSRVMLIGSCECSAEDCIKFKPKTEKSIENYMKGIVENNERNGSVFGVNLNEFLVALDETNNVIIPQFKLNKEKQEIILDGMSIIKDYKVIGQFDPEQVFFIQIMRGKLKGGNKLLVYKEHPVDIFIDNSKSYISVNESKNNLNFNINVELEGVIRGYQIDENLFTDKDLFYIEQNFDKLLKNQCLKVIESCQKKYGVDFIGINEYLKKYKPNLWDKVKDNWEEIYKKADINVNIKSKIRRIGVSK